METIDDQVPLDEKVDRMREYWRNASRRYYEKHREEVKAKKLANYYKKLGMHEVAEEDADKEN